MRGSVTLIHLSSDLSEGGPFMTPTSQLITLLKVPGQHSPFLYAFKFLPPLLPPLESVSWGLFSGIGCQSFSSISSFKLDHSGERP